jgi:quercetin dioxygenase-like cupin family protein
MDSMPHVAPDEGLNRSFAALADIGSAMGVEPGGGPARVALVGSPGLRVVLLRWPPGFATVPHHHPHAEEVFLVLEGRATFIIGSAPPRLVEPGVLVLARRGERHAIEVPDDVELLLLAAVAPNEDRADETLE